MIVLIISILWLMFIVLSAINNKRMWKKADSDYITEYRKTMKFKSYYNTLIKWMKLKNSEKNICDFFDKNVSIAVYGMGEIGKLICYELKQGEKNLKYGMDQNNYGYDSTLDLIIYSSDADVVKVDYFIISMSNMADKIVPSIEDKAVHIMTIDELIIKAM